MRDRIIEWLSSNEFYVYIPGYWEIYLTTLICGFILALIIAYRDGYSIIRFIYKTIIVILISLLFARLYGIAITIIQSKSFPSFDNIIHNNKTGSFGEYTGIIIGAFISNKFDKIESFKLLDVYAPVLGFNLFLGRIGCFMSGCCYGKISNLPWSVSFPRNSVVFINQQRQSFVSILDQYTLPIQPTQLYESFFGLFLFIYLLTRRKKNRNAGELVITFFLLYSSFRIIIEFFRADEKIHLGFITLRQALYLIILILCTIIWYKLRRKERIITQ